MGNIVGKMKTESDKGVIPFSWKKMTGGNNENKEATNRNEEARRRSIPEGMIMEVLLKLPLKPLARAQLVCKQWRAMILDHQFMVEHMSRSPCVRHWHNIVDAAAESSQPADALSVTYLHGCDGLLLVTIAKNHMLWNPATSFILDLPPPHKGSYGFALCFTRNYKIVSLFKESDRHGCEVLTPGPSMAWRRLAFPKLASAGAEELRVWVVPAGGDVHCVVVTKAEEAEIVSLDVESELFTLSRVGRGVFDRVESARAIDWDGKLAFAAVVGKDLQVMVLEDYRKKKKKSWCGGKEVIPLPFLKEKGGDHVVALFKKEGGIWFWLEGEKIVVYTVDTGKVSDVKKSKRFSPSNKMYSYKPSMVTFEGMRKDDELKAFRPRNLVLD